MQCLLLYLYIHNFKQLSCKRVSIIILIKQNFTYNKQPAAAPRFGRPGAGAPSAPSPGTALVTSLKKNSQIPDKINCNSLYQYQVYRHFLNPFNVLFRRHRQFQLHKLMVLRVARICVKLPSYSA